MSAFYLTHGSIYNNSYTSYLTVTFLAFPVAFFGSAVAFLTAVFFATGFDLAAGSSFTTDSLAVVAFFAAVFFAASTFACNLANTYSNSVISSP